MEGYGADTYGRLWSPVYDQLFSTVDTEMIDRLTELAREGRVLELAIGTGRVALPLRERGVQVAGIDISEEMVARLRSKPGGGEVEITMGDISEVAVEGAYSLIYLVFNTLFGLSSQEEQLRCFQNVAAHLERGGRFVTETFFPEVTRFDRDQRVSLIDMGIDRAHLEVSRHNRALQRVDAQQLHVTEQGIRIFPVAIRYAWPAEMDLMGLLAGLELEDRWGGWDRRVFDYLSGQHISIYRRP